MLKNFTLFSFILLIIIFNTGCPTNQPESFDEICDYSEGLAIIRSGGLCGYIDTQKRLVIPAKFDDAYDFSEGLAAVSFEIRRNFTTCCKLAVYKWGFIDKNGSFVILPQFDSVSSFNGGIAAVELNKKWGYINKGGDLIVKPQFDNIETSQLFTGGPALVKLNSKYGYINKSGKFVIPAKYDAASPFFKGHKYTQVEINGEKFSIDKNGIKKYD
jgi:hypothetical protein